ncbi:hypothetical protein ACLBXJ_26890 [Methylobacterium mesophilicum]
MAPCLHAGEIVDLPRQPVIRSGSGAEPDGLTARSRYFEYFVRSGRSMARCAIMDTLDPSLIGHASALERVARALNVPVSGFLSERPADDADDVLALLRLWSEIEDSQGRRRVLSMARQEAERGGYKGCA